MQLQRNFHQSTTALKTAFLFAAFMLAGLQTGLAVAYVFSGTGNWTDAARWSPSYPGVNPERYVPSGADNSITISTGAVCTVNAWINANIPITNNGTIKVINNQRFYIKSSHGNVVNAGTMIIEVGGVLQNEKNLTNNAGCTITFLGQLYNINGATFTNNGTFVGEAGSNLGNDGVWTNTSGSVVNSSSSNFGMNYTLAKLNINAGATFNNKSGSLLRISKGTLTNSGTFNNSGTLECWISIINASGGNLINTGKLDLRTGGQLQNNGTVETTSVDNNIYGSINTGGTGVLKGTGKLSGGPFYNYGTLAPGTGNNIGILTLGYINQTGLDCRSGGKVEIQIAGTGGPGAANGHDQLVLPSSKAAFSLVGVGSINISLLNGYVPAPGTSFQILDCVGLSPMATMNYPALPNGRTWSHSFTYSGSTISGIKITAN